MNVTPNIAGKYYCQAKNKAGIKRKAFDVAVHVPPSVTTEQQIDARVTGEAALTCYATGTPEPEIKWLKNGHEIQGRRFSYEDNVLIISQVSLADQGRVGNL